MSDQAINQGANNESQAGEDDEDFPRPDELTVLKERARLLGITFSNNIGLEALKAKVNDKLVQDDPDEGMHPAREPDYDDTIEDDAPDMEEPDSEQEYTQSPEEMRAEMEVLRKQVARMAAQSEVQSIRVAEPAALNPLAGDTVTQKPAIEMSKRQLLKRESMRLLRCRITNLDPKKKDLYGEILTVGNRMIGTVKKFIPYGEQTDNGFHIPKILYDELESRKFLHVQSRQNKQTGQIDVKHSYAKEFSIEVMTPLTQSELAQLAAQQSAASDATNQN